MVTLLNQGQKSIKSQAQVISSQKLGIQVLGLRPYLTDVPTSSYLLKKIKINRHGKTLHRI